MSFIEYPDCFLWECNTCGKEVAFKPHDFFACVAELKARQWSFSPPDGEDGWRHTCGFCNYKSKQTSILDQRIQRVK